MIVSLRLKNFNGKVTNVNVHFQSILILKSTRQKNIPIRILFLRLYNKNFKMTTSALSSYIKSDISMR
jgi:hypothetical protein